MVHPIELPEELAFKLEAIDLTKISIDTINQLPQELTTLTIKIKGDQFDGTITGEMARALWDLQASYYRAAALILHGSENIATLSDEEKHSLEIVFSVEKGCSLYSFNLGEFFASVFPDIIKTMPPEYSMIIIIAFLIAAVGGYGYKSWLDYRRDIDLKKLDNEKDSEHEKTVRESYRTIERLVEEKAKPFETVKETHAPKIAKAAHDAIEVDFANHHFGRDEIVELNKRSPRTKAKSETKSMSLKIRGIENDEKYNRLKVKVTDVDTNENFDAFIAPAGMFVEQDEFSVPHSATNIAEAIDNKTVINAEVLITETKTKIERHILSWFDPTIFPNSEEDSQG